MLRIVVHFVRFSTAQYKCVLTLQTFCMLQTLLTDLFADYRQLLFYLQS